MLLIASLWHEKRSLRHRPFHLEWHDDFLGGGMEALAYLKDSLKEQFGIRFLQFSLVFVGEALVYCAILHVHIIDVRIGAVFIVVDSEDIDVIDGEADHLALGAELLDKEVFLLQFLGFLKLQFLRLFQHLVVDDGGEMARVAAQYLACRTDILHIIVVALLSGAWCSAVAEMVFQARLVFSAGYIVAIERKIAGARVVELAYKVEDGVHGGEVRVRSVIGACDLIYSPCLENSGE